jgi:hypothetical protein
MEMRSEEMPVAQKVAIGKVISPPVDSQEEYYNQATIIKGLSSDTIFKKLELRLYGYRFSEVGNKWVQVSKPIMNDIGINKLLLALEGVGDLASFSNYDQKQVNRLADHYFSRVYPEFILYAVKFDLENYRYGDLAIILLSSILSLLSNAKGAGHRNTIRGVMSESVLAKALEGGKGEQEKKGFLSGLNPFSKKK